MSTDTAIHEAGHAVAHVRLGLDHEGAHIVADGNGLLGAATGEGQAHVWNTAGAERVVLAFCAGYAALVASGGDHGQAVDGTGDDFEQAQELIDFWGLAGDLAVWQRRAVELMRKPENLAAVALVARHLQERKRLDGELVDVLVSVADGETTEEEFETYLAYRGGPDEIVNRTTEGDTPPASG